MTIGSKQVRMATQLQRQISSFGKKMNDSEGEINDQKKQSLPTRNNVQAVGLTPSQGTASMCPTRFQNCSGLLPYASLIPLFEQ